MDDHTPTNGLPAPIAKVLENYRAEEQDLSVRIAELTTRRDIIRELLDQLTDKPVRKRRQRDAIVVPLEPVSAPQDSPPEAA